MWTPAQKKAWELYCNETKGSPAAVDFWHQVPKAYQEDLLKRVTSNVSGSQES